MILTLKKESYVSKLLKLLLEKQSVLEVGKEPYFWEQSYMSLTTGEDRLP